MIRWAEDRLPGIRFRADAQAIGLERVATDGTRSLCAVVVYDTFSPGQCQMHVVSEGRMWWSKLFAQHVAIHAFRTGKLHRISCTISEDNARALLFARRMGCKLEGRFREAGPKGEDYLSFGLLARECHYLPPAALGGIAKAS
jgi:hypothetical protein